MLVILEQQTSSPVYCVWKLDFCHLNSVEVNKISVEGQHNTLKDPVR